jgi:mannan endo-1,4-beta-mannosidase
MKDWQFDELARELGDGTSRRGILRLLGGAAALGTGLGLALGEVDAKKSGRHGNGRHNHLAAQKKGKGKKGGKGKGKGKGKKKKKKTNPPAIGPHFSVFGRSIVDTNGNPVLLRGVNKMSVFDEDVDPVGAISFPAIAATKANTVRIVWAMSTDTQPGGTNPAVMDTLIANARAQGLVPMIELHDATGNFSLLNSLVNYWTQPNIVNIIKKHQAYLLVNIGNEVGDDSVSDAQFIAGYTNAVQRMRTAGIHTPLVIDASSFGKDLEILNRTAAPLLAADPDHNLIFSVHTYWGLADGADANFIRDQFAAAVAANYPLIVGEFSKTGAVDPNTFDSTCLAPGDILYKEIIKRCQEHSIGWYAWEWGPGNSFGGPNCGVMDMTDDRQNLKAGWATEVALTDPNSIQNTSRAIF